MRAFVTHRDSNVKKKVYIIWHTHTTTTALATAGCNKNIIIDNCNRVVPPPLLPPESVPLGPVCRTTTMLYSRGLFSRREETTPNTQQYKRVVFAVDASMGLVWAEFLWRISPKRKRQRDQGRPRLERNCFCCVAYPLLGPRGLHYTPLSLALPPWSAVYVPPSSNRSVR